MRRTTSTAAAALAAAGLAAAGLAVGATARPAAAEPPQDLTGQVTDLAEVLSPGEEEEVRAALDGLAAERDIDLHVTFVDTLDGLTGPEWAEQTFAASGLGGGDAVLVVAVQDRVYGYHEDTGVSTDRAEEIATGSVEPELRDDDWAGAALAAAQGYQHDDEPFAWGLFAGIWAVCLTAVGAPWLFLWRGRVRTRRAKETALLERRAALARGVVDLEELVGSAQTEAGYAAADLGEREEARLIGHASAARDAVGSASGALGTVPAAPSRRAPGDKDLASWGRRLGKAEKKVTTTTTSLREGLDRVRTARLLLEDPAELEALGSRVGALATQCGDTRQLLAASASGPPALAADAARRAAGRVRRAPRGGARGSPVGGGPPGARSPRRRGRVVAARRGRVRRGRARPRPGRRPGPGGPRGDGCARPRPRGADRPPADRGGGAGPPRGVLPVRQAGPPGGAVGAPVPRRARRGPRPGARADRLAAGPRRRPGGPCPAAHRRPRGARPGRRPLRVDGRGAGAVARGELLLVGVLGLVGLVQLVVVLELVELQRRREVLMRSAPRGMPSPAAVLLALLLGVAGAGAPLAGPARAEPPERLAEELTDHVGAVADPGAMAEVQDRLVAEKSLQLFVVVVEDFDGLAPDDWLAQTSRLSQLGERDLAVVLSADPAGLALRVPDAARLDPSDVREVEARAREAVTAGDLDRAVTAVATGLDQARQEDPQARLARRGWWLAGAALAVALLAAGLWVVATWVRRRRADAEHLAAAARLAREHGSLAVAVDDALQEADVEVGFARAEFDPPLVASLAEIVASARDQSLAAHRLRGAVAEGPVDALRWQVAPARAHEDLGRAVEETRAALERLRTIPLQLNELRRQSDLVPARAAGLRALAGGPDVPPAVAAQVAPLLDRADADVAAGRPEAALVPLRTVVALLGPAVSASGTAAGSPPGRGEPGR